MDWGKFTYLLGIIIIGYAPYKILQKTRRQGLNDISLITAVLLGIWFCILSWLLFVQAGDATLHTTKEAVWLFTLTTVLWFLAPFLVRKVGVFPKKLVAEKPSWFVVRFEPRTFYLKYFEVIFQQTKFLFMLFIVLAALPYAARVFWFTMIIGFFHFNNLFFLPKREAMIFFILSFPMAVLFSFMIMNGFLLITTSMHLWFYLVFGGYPWLKRDQGASHINVLTR